MMKAASCALMRSTAQALSTGLRASGVAVNAVGKPPSIQALANTQHYIMLPGSSRFLCEIRQNQSKSSLNINIKEECA